MKPRLLRFDPDKAEAEFEADTYYVSGKSLVVTIPVDAARIFSGKRVHVKIRLVREVEE